jgi:hypothetical protein
MKFKPRVDAQYLWIAIPTELFLLVMTVMTLVHFTLFGLIIMLAALAFSSFFILSPIFFGYAELREDELFVDFGIFIKRSIPYSKIRKIEKKSSFYSESMLSLKCARDHVNIKYNSFDIISLSLKDEDSFIEELHKKIP